MLYWGININILNIMGPDTLCATPSGICKADYKPKININVREVENRYMVEVSAMIYKTFVAKTLDEVKEIINENLK